MAVPLASNPNTSTLVAKQYIERLSNDLRKDQPILKVMKSTFTTNRKQIFSIRRLPPGVSPSNTFPSASTLMVSRAFGKPCLSQSYCVSKSLSHIAVLLWKYSYFDDVCDTLTEAYGSVGRTAYARVNAVANIDFSALQLLPLDWDITEPTAEEEAAIQDNKTTMLDACLVHYNMNLESV